MQGIDLQDQLVYGEQASALAISWTSAAPHGGVWAQPSIVTYDYGLRAEVISQKSADMGDAARLFLRRDSFFDSIKEV